MTDIDNAIDLLIRGFARLERALHPVEERVSGAVRYLRWSERGRRGAEFSEEFFAVDLDPTAALAAVRAANPGADHLIAEVSISTQPSTGAYLSAGYELGSQEPLMLAHLTDANSTPSTGTDIRRLESMAEAELILAAHRSVGYPERLFSPALLTDPRVMIRVAYEGGEPVALGKMATIESGAYITDVMTLPDHRRTGYGEAVMRRLHADARAAGHRRAALTSTAMARPLYERLGYRLLGTVTLWATPERPRT